MILMKPIPVMAPILRWSMVAASVTLLSSCFYDPYDSYGEGPYGPRRPQYDRDGGRGYDERYDAGREAQARGEDYGADAGARFGDGGTARRDEYSSPATRSGGSSSGGSSSGADTKPTYPVAEKTSNPNRVISPYAPYNVVDVEGFRSGQLARDPANKKIFRVP